MSASDKYFDARSKKRDPKDLSADDNFLIESSIFNSYSERSEAYQSLLIEESDSNKPAGEMFKLLFVLTGTNQFWRREVLPQRFTIKFYCFNTAKMISC